MNKLKLAGAVLAIGTLFSVPVFAEGDDTTMVSCKSSMSQDDCTKANGTYADNACVSQMTKADCTKAGGTVADTTGTQGQ